MWVRANTQLSEHVVQVCGAASSHIVIGSELAAIVDAGLALDTERLAAGISSVLDDLTLEYILLTHVSFDHVGGIAGLRRSFPEARLLASPASSEMLMHTNLLQEMYAKNIDAAAAMGQKLDVSYDDWAEALKVDVIIRDGDSIPIGEDVEVKVIACPGYSADSHGYLVRPDAALAAGHAIGDYGGRDKLLFGFRGNLAEFLATLEKLSQLELKVASLPHSGALTGELANRSLFHLRDEIVKFRDQVRTRIAAGELLADVTQGMYAEWLELGLHPDGPFVSTAKETFARMVELAAQEG